MISTNNLPVLKADTDSTKWFVSYLDGSSSTYYGPDKDASLTNAIARMTITKSYTNSSATSPLLSSSNRIIMKYAGKTNQIIELPDVSPTNSLPLPAAGQTNIYYLIAQPRGDGGYRGDPRFGAFTTYVKADANTTNFDGLGLVDSLGKLNTINPTNAAVQGNWRIDDFAVADSQPDLMDNQQVFGKNASGSPNDRGLANLSFSISAESGLAQLYAGIGWIGEVPVTTVPNATREALAWSTPRLWGNGRPKVDSTAAAYPPDWLLLDSLHMSPSSTNAFGAFDSYGRVNINSGKSFFQTISGNTTKGDTIIDSVVINARTKDWWWGGSGDGIETVPSTNSTRTDLLHRIRQMTESRNAANTPYTTHFEFLADLAATNLPNSPSWWMAPDPATGGGNIYAATNTTDRRIEGIVRSLNQKFTTHGNQFSIFSLGQALQVVNGRTNVVGEAYLQAVYERAPQYNEATGAITNGPSGAASVPPMRQLYLRELRY
jgi:hypothetical protein